MPLRELVLRSYAYSDEPSSTASDTRRDALAVDGELLTTQEWSWSYELCMNLAWVSCSAFPFYLSKKTGSPHVAVANEEVKAVRGQRDTTGVMERLRGSRDTRMR